MNDLTTVFDIKAGVGAAVSGGTAAAGQVVGNGGIIALNEVAQLILTLVSICVGAATFVYMLRGVVGRGLENRIKETDLKRRNDE